LGADPVDVLREALTLCPARAVFDFEVRTGQPVAWLAPLREAIRRHAIDLLYDHGVVGNPDRAADAVTELATDLVSPVDLLDGADVLLDQLAAGVSVAPALAEARARLLAGRFDATEVGQPADGLVRSFVAVHESGEADRARFEGVGLWDGGPTPLVQRLSDRGVLRRALRHLTDRRPLDEPLDDLGPAWLVEKEGLGTRPLALPAPTPFDSGDPGTSTVDDPALRAVQRYLEREQWGAAAQRVLEIDGRGQSRWTRSERRLAAHALMAAGGGVTRDTIGPDVQAVAARWYRRAVGFYQDLDDVGSSARALCRAGFAQLAAGDPSAATLRSEPP